MDFASVRLGSFEKNACSPVTPSPEWEGLLVNVPAEIGWGDPVPICGLLKVRKEDAGKPGSARVNITFAKPIAANTGISAVLFDAKIPAPAYFNFDALDATRGFGLPPGAHELSLDAMWGIYQTKPRKFTVRASGWRNSFAQSLTKSICSAHLMEDLKEYFQRLAWLELETPASPESLQAMISGAARAWMTGFANHRAMLSMEIRKELFASQAGEPAVPWYVAELVRSRCPDQFSDDLERIVGKIQYAITKYER